MEAGASLQLSLEGLCSLQVHKSLSLGSCFLFCLFGVGAGRWLTFDFCVVLLGGSRFLFLLWEVITDLNANGFLVKIYILTITLSKHFKNYFGSGKDIGMEEAACLR